MVKTLKGNKGQIAIEFVLITVVLVSFALFIFGEVKKRRIFPQMVDGPSELLRGMVESGSWRPAKQARDNHPSMLNRKVSAKFN
jgi:hypothetical protein